MILCSVHSALSPTCEGKEVKSSISFEIAAISPGIKFSDLFVPSTFFSLILLAQCNVYMVHQTVSAESGNQVWSRSVLTIQVSPIY